MVKQTIILRKRANPKVVNLPNSRSFTSKWERISTKQPPINIRVNRRQTIGPRRNNRMIYLNQTAPEFREIKRKRKQNIINRLGPVDDRVQRNQQNVFDRLGPVYDRVQGGRRLALNLPKAGLEFRSKAISSDFGKELINKGIDNIPSIFKFGVSKIKNKNVERAMKSDIAKMVVNEAKNRVKNKYDNLFD